MRRMLKVAAFLLWCCVANLPLVDAAAKEPLPDCGTIYKCLVPETCTTDEPTKMTFSASTTMVVAEASTPVTKDCAAIFRYHSYASHWIYVSIESLLSGTSSIVFNHKKDSDIAVFECKLVNGKVEGKYSAIGVSAQLKPHLTDSKSDPLKCVFEVIVTRDTQVIAASSRAKTQFVIGPQQSKYTALNIEIVNCDPSKLKFKSEKLNPLEKYTEIEYGPGKYECKRKPYDKLEFRLQNSDTYKVAKKLECGVFQFSITEDGSDDTIEVPDDNVLYVRCVADAQYFCNYKVKTIALPSGDVKPPIQTLPRIDIDPPQIGEIKCPSTHRFIEVKGKFVTGSEIKCKSSGSVMQWTVKDKGIDKVLRQNSVEVSCVKDLKCHEMNKIPASSIRKGTLINHLPFCRANGTMKVMPSSNTANNVYCDKQSGKYMYTTDTQDFEVGTSTFECEYPTIVIGNKKEEENKSTAIKTGAITTGVIIGGSIALFIIVVVATAFLRTYLVKKRAMKRDQAEWDNHAAGKEEKKAKMKLKENLGKNKGSQSGSENNGTSSNLLHFSERQVTLNATSPKGFGSWMMIPGISELSGNGQTLKNVIKIGDDTIGLETSKKIEMAYSETKWMQSAIHYRIAKVKVDNKASKSKSAAKKHK